MPTLLQVLFAVGLGAPFLAAAACARTRGTRCAGLAAGAMALTVLPFVDPLAVAMAQVDGVLSAMSCGGGRP